MCRGWDMKNIQAQRYLADAKKRTKHLKKLKSVSRAYRKAEVRGLKRRAWELQQEHEEGIAALELQRKQGEMLVRAGVQNYGQQSGYNGINAALSWLSGRSY